MKLLFLNCIFLIMAWGQRESLVQQVPPGNSAGRNPLEGDERARRAGAKLYARECSACHGRNAEGLGKAPPLRSVEVYEAPAGALFWILENGSLHHGMPSFAHLPEAQRWQIITFLHSLNQKESDPRPRISSRPKFRAATS
jgi:mono/diheme cytochrome c family protein